jgi:hypothetical protein
VIPRPVIFAAQLQLKTHQDLLHTGSRAALSIVVTPFAKVAAVIIFSVAPTLGNSKFILAPVKSRWCLCNYIPML